MSLVPNYDDSSNSSNLSSSDSEKETTCPTDKKEPVQKPKLLPTPTFNCSKNISTEETTSVFKNPFLEAENAKEAILQKHVKMVDVKDKIDYINGKKICWNYRFYPFCTNFSPKVFYCCFQKYTFADFQEKDAVDLATTVNLHMTLTFKKLKSKFKLKMKRLSKMQLCVKTYHR
ncbi:unnamed protein product [Acanthoscelides obtectus]|uniref:Uncharacterized protein n=1 Tax=Acanthoscelides obtectus TaxID=200917 RepID=A0A9P0MHV5_ACAOB|nr:unnamed protein product [Acanthoscelides obtectus]CAK1624612.1 hypothetical protein AOBTE_LOCUS2646 [Acanthoscelides obtectus]